MTVPIGERIRSLSIPIRLIDHRCNKRIRVFNRRIALIALPVLIQIDIQKGIRLILVVIVRKIGCVHFRREPEIREIGHRPQLRLHVGFEPIYRLPLSRRVQAIVIV